VKLAFFTVQPLTAGIMVSTLLLWCLVIRVGIGGIYAFLGHFFAAYAVARRIGWPAGNPFQLAFSNLAIGVAGLCCFAVRDGFWLATIIVVGVFLFSAGLGHIWEKKARGNVAELNTGVMLAWTFSSLRADSPLYRKRGPGRVTGFTPLFRRARIPGLVQPSLPTMNETFTIARYSTILPFSTFAVHSFRYTPLMSLIVFAASFTAFAAASSQPFGELPISSMTFATEGSCAAGIFFTQPYDIRHLL
jgi:hypothetical protein